mgnify:FL=1
MKAIYIRVSTSEQNTDRQKINIQDCKIYEEKVSGVIPFAERPYASKLIKDIINGLVDEVEVSNLNRLGRNMKDIITTIAFFNEHKVNLFVKDLNINSLDGEKKQTQAFFLISSVMAMVSEMQRTEIRDNTLQGIEIAKKKGVYQARATRGTVSDKKLLEKYKNVVKDIKKGNATAQILKTNYIIYDKDYLALPEDVKKRFKGKTISRNTYKKIKALLN